MNGLETDFGDQITFLSVDANSRDGQAAFRAYQLQGHPAYAVIDSSGEVLWTGLGEQSGESLAEQLNRILNNP